jgi:hypothetical protein
LLKKEYLHQEVTEEEEGYSTEESILEEGETGIQEATLTSEVITMGHQEVNLT